MIFLFSSSAAHRDLPSFPTRRSSDLIQLPPGAKLPKAAAKLAFLETIEKDHGRFEIRRFYQSAELDWFADRSEEHTSELQSHSDLVCRLLLEKKKEKKNILHRIRQIE